MMQLQWLGTGSMMNVELGNTSFVLRGDGGRVVLVDCGFTVPAALRRFGLIDEITDILITHQHSDHVGGLETFGFYRYFLSGNTTSQKVRLHVASGEMARALWDNTLSGGMGRMQDDQGVAMRADMATYFEVNTGTRVALEGLPEISFVPRRHVAGMENYGLYIGDQVYVSGDTIDLPPTDVPLIFQDCQFFPPDPGEVHMPYERLFRDLPVDARKKTYLVHLPDNFRDTDVCADGFAGFVHPGQIFEIETR